MSDTERFLSYTIQSTGSDGKLQAVFRSNHLSRSGELHTCEGGCSFSEESLTAYIAYLEREGQDVSLPREALTALHMALAQNANDHMLRNLRTTVLGDAPGSTADPSDLMLWYESAMQATLQVQEEAAEMLRTRIAAMETIQAQREQAMRLVLKMQNAQVERASKSLQQSVRETMLLKNEEYSLQSFGWLPGKVAEKLSKRFVKWSD
jgi:hypothetical protein